MQSVDVVDDEVELIRAPATGLSCRSGKEIADEPGGKCSVNSSARKTEPQACFRPLLHSLSEPACRTRPWRGRTAS